jgi:hypothetical protein
VLLESVWDLVLTSGRVTYGCAYAAHFPTAEEGAGGKYLIQHSAGSGKTNSIAWAAHFLADLHDAKDQKLFSTVIVVSDRNVIDGQLQDALAAFERTQGVVVTVRSESGSKSGQLAAALAQGKKIIVCTIQTFPFALYAVREQAATHGKRFAVIADEAHSSQTGETAAKLKAVLTADELTALQDGGEVSAEDILAAQMAARAGEKGITYVAFTATPKTKTLELFGRRPNPDDPASDTNKPEAFHVYSMRQAIEEGFNPKARQGDLVAAIEPVADRLLKRFKAAQERKRKAAEEHDEKAAQAAQDELAALLLFKNDIGAYQRMYSFLSQMFDYGNTAIEKRFLFFRRLMPLLEFGREREGVDLSKVTLTHHALKTLGKIALAIGDGEPPKLAPLTEAGSGAINEKEKARLAEIIARVNGLFEGELTDDDQLVYVNNVIKGKLLESQELAEQAVNNTKAQFANSPTLSKELTNAIIDALAAHTAMSKQALDSERVREGLKDVLLGPAQLYEALREKAGQQTGV